MVKGTSSIAIGGPLVFSNPNDISPVSWAPLPVAGCGACGSALTHHRAAPPIRSVPFLTGAPCVHGAG